MWMKPGIRGRLETKDPNMTLVTKHLTLPADGVGAWHAACGTRAWRMAQLAFGCRWLSREPRAKPGPAPAAGRWLPAGARAGGDSVVPGSD